MFPTRADLVVMMMMMMVMLATASDDGVKCDKSTSLTYNIVSEYNETGQWVAKVSGQRVNATPGAEPCPWAIDIGHEVRECGDAPSVKIAANIQMDSGVPYDVGLATDELDADGKVPPTFGEYEIHGDSKYKLYLKLRKWDVAQSLCREDDANLLVINSEEEANVIIEILKENPQISDDPYENKQIWVGLHDRSQEGHFMSVYNESLSDLGYAEWAQGEPNDLGSSEDCVSVLRNGRLNDEICTKKLAFICEKVLPSIY